MKKFESLLLILLVMMFFIPLNAFAEDKKPEANKEPVKVYLFRSDSCGYCKAALEWFNSIEEEYGDYFDLIDYEVSIEENSQLYTEVAEFMGDIAQGVPYMVVGKYSYPNGFAADTIIDSETKKTAGDQLIERILEEYAKDNRYDVMVAISDKPDYSVVVGVGAAIIIVGLTVVAIISRRQNREN